MIANTTLVYTDIVKGGGTSTLYRTALC